MRRPGSRHEYVRVIEALLSAVMLIVAVSAAREVSAQTVLAQILGFDASKFPQVRAFVSVTDKNGHAIQQLKQADFAAREDGQPMKVLAVDASDEAIHVGLVIDHSGSMADQGKLADAQTAATAFVREMRSQDEAFLSVFDDTITLLQDFTNNQDTLEQAITKIVPNDGTAFYDAVFAGAQKFDGRQDKPKKALILLTDGLDNRSSHSASDAIAKSTEMNVRLYTIGLGSDADRTGLQQLADKTGGKFFYSPGGQQLKELYQLIAEQLQKDYAVDLESPRPRKDGTRRQVDIEVTLSDGARQTARGVYVAGFLFNRFYTDLPTALVLGGFLLMLGFGPTLVRNWPRVGARRVSIQQCPRCSSQNRIGARFCGKCGLSFANIAPPLPANSCPQCHSAVRLGARFCGRCGYRFF